MLQSQLHVVACKEGGALRLSVAGELDRATAERLEVALEEGLEGRTDEVELDLSAVSFLDLGGIRALLRAHRRTRDEGAALAVVRPSNSVRRVFTLTRLGHLLAPDPNPRVVNPLG